MSERTRRRPPPTNAERERGTLAERAQARRVEFEQAKEFALANPDDDEAQERLARARRAYAARMPIEDLERRAVAVLDMLAMGSTTIDIINQLTADGLSTSGAYRVLESAIDELRSLPLEAYRKITVARLELLASEARSERDYASATRATIAAAKLAGVVAEKVETTVTVKREEPDTIPEAIAEALNDPKVARFYLLFNRMPQPGESLEGLPAPPLPTLALTGGSR